MTRLAKERAARDPRLSATLAGVAVLLLGLACGGARAEFHVWHDAEGRKHVSTIPARGFDARGKPFRGHDPNSVVYQHRHMLARLEARRAELAARAATERHASLRAGAAVVTPPTHRPAREGLMSLDELIALEKRGGRWQGQVSDQGTDRARSK